MSETSREGRPAFPTLEFYDEKLIGCEPGMSLRDWLAGMAMQGGLMNPNITEARKANAKKELGVAWMTEEATRLAEKQMAEAAYSMADAILMARKL